MNGAVISFWTRTALNPALAPDRLHLRLSDSGLSTMFSDFDIVLSVNNGLTPTGYPADWTQYSYTVLGLSGPTLGRFALNYSVPDTSVAGDYIGIDNVQASATVIPEPATVGLLVGAALAGAFTRLRKRRLSVLLAGAIAVLASASEAQAQSRATSDKEKARQAVKVTVIHAPSMAKGLATPSTGRRAEIEGAATPGVQSLGARSRSGDATVSRLTGGGYVAKLGRSYMPAVIAVKNVDGSISVRHDGGKNKEVRRDQ
jgi:hypothetical protein